MAVPCHLQSNVTEELTFVPGALIRNTCCPTVAARPQGVVWMCEAKAKAPGWLPAGRGDHTAALVCTAGWLPPLDIRCPPASSTG